MKSAKDLNGVKAELNDIYLCLNTKTWHKLINYFRNKIPPLTEGDIEDEFASGWIKLITNRDKFDSSKTNNFFSYIFTIMKNLVSNNLQRKEKHEASFTALGLNAQNDDEESLDKFDLLLKNSDQGQIVSVLDQTSYKLKKNAIDRALETLEGRQIKVYKMRVENEIGFKEIAEELDMQASNVHRTFKSAIKRINHYFESNYNITLEDYLRDCDV